MDGCAKCYDLWRKRLHSTNRPKYTSTDRDLRFYISQLVMRGDKK